MSDDLFGSSTTAELDDKIWQAWVAKNREAERLLNTRIARIAIAAVGGLTIFAVVWLTAIGKA